MGKTKDLGRRKNDFLYLYPVCATRSKKRIVWQFTIDGEAHTIELTASFARGRRKIFHNKELIHEKTQ